MTPRAGTLVEATNKSRGSRLALFAAFFIAATASSQTPRAQDWGAFGGQTAQNHYSSLRQIDRSNVRRLEKVWSVDLHESGGLQTNPLIIGGRLYAYTPSQKVIALDAATGRELWTFSAPKPGLQPVRGLTWWTDGKRSVLFASALSQLFALDPATGQPIRSFGEGGSIDLRQGLTNGDYTKGFVAMTTPGVVYKDMIIVGFRAPESKPALPGDIRAFDVHTGAVRWTFHTIPHPGEFGYDTWPKDAWKTAGAANNWAGMALDEKRGIVYAPTGSAVDDFYGADRVGSDLFANTLLALDANTGQRLWHFQGVHHDIWDRDFPSAPALVTVHSGGQTVDALVQTTKQGMLFLFDRVTGKPLFPIREERFPASTVPGEVASSTQPVASIPAPFARQLLTEDMLTRRTPAARAWALSEFRNFRSEGQFVPLSVDRATVIFPGFDGGAEWGGSAVDPRTATVYINANDLAWTAGLVERKRGGTIGARTYSSQCAACHGADRKGSPPAFPSLVDLSARLTDSAVTEVVHGGKGRMPSFPAVEADALKSLLDYLKTNPAKEAAAASAPINRAQTIKGPGAQVYARNCAICHGEDLGGNASNMPGLLGVRSRMTDPQIVAIVNAGKGRMPAFAKLPANEVGDLMRFLGPPLRPAQEDKVEMENAGARAFGAPRYNFTGYRKFLDPDGYPAVAPPWGTLNAIDLNTGKYLWKVPLGEYPELAAQGVPITGTENYGGPIVTAGGVLFIGATNFDRKLRAFDSATGELLWQGELPYSGNATPATYMVAGRQYVVIATSGQRNPKGPQGAAYVAFALHR